MAERKRDGSWRGDDHSTSELDATRGRPGSRSNSRDFGREDEKARDFDANRGRNEERYDEVSRPYEGQSYAGSRDFGRGDFGRDRDPGSYGSDDRSSDRTSFREGSRNYRPMQEERPSDQEFHSDPNEYGRGRAAYDDALPFSSQERDQNVALPGYGSAGGTMSDDYFHTTTGSPIGRFEHSGDDTLPGFRRAVSAKHSSFRGVGPKNFMRSDERLRERVSELLEDDPNVDASDIEVVVVAGEVTLTGTVADRHMKRRAEDLAESVYGVRDVNNDVKVNRGFFSRLSDTLTRQQHEESDKETAARSDRAKKRP